MNTEVKALWTGALRSGDYTQGIGVLKTPNDEFCCLGVLCELAVEAGVIPPVESLHSDDDGSVISYRYNTETGVLPNAVQEWAGLEDSEGSYELDDSEVAEKYPIAGPEELKNYHRRTSLINANDSGGYNFSQIADLIEKHF